MTPHSIARVLASLALALLAGRASAQRSPDVFDDPRIVDEFEMREQAAAGEDLEVIVSLTRTERMRAFRSWDDRGRVEDHCRSVAALIQRVLDRVPSSDFTLRRSLDIVPQFAARTTPTGLRALLASPLVEWVFLDRPMQLHTDQGITLMNGDMARTVFTGSRLSIAIVDTGINYAHEALGGGGFPNAKVIGGWDFGDNDGDPMDLEGHGSSVAGIAAGDVTVSGDYVGGVAPGARLYAVKVTSGSSTQFDSSDVLSGLNWCVLHKNDDPSHPILVINASFGVANSRHATSCNVHVYDAAAATIASAGITFLASSGNDGYCDAMNSPACDPDVLAVGAVYDADVGKVNACVSSFSCVEFSIGACASGHGCTDFTTAPDQVPCFSNSASFLALLAPGNDVWAPYTFGSNGYISFGGTSAACPYAAGAAALVIDAARASGITLAPSTVRTTLSGTGDPITDPKSSVTTPRVNIGDAVGLWVDHGYASTEIGTFPQPFNTLGEGVSAVAPGGILKVKAGTTSSTITITKALHLQSFAGDVVIGQ